MSAAPPTPSAPGASGLASRGGVARAAPPPRWLHRGLTAVLTLLLLWTVMRMHVAGQPLWAVGLLTFGAIGLVVYAGRGSVAWKYLFPGVAGMLLFIAVPLLYTVQIGFTNYSSSNLLTEERSRAYLLEQTETDEGTARRFTLHRDATGLRLVLAPPEEAAAAAGGPLVSPPLPAAAPATPVALQPGAAPPGEPLALRDVIAQRPLLIPLRLQLPDGTVLSYAGLREFGVVRPVWEPLPDGALRQRASGTVYRPNPDTGFFETAQGERVSPGFRVGIGFANYARMVLDADFRGPFLAIFVWTVTFAGLTVLFATAIGMTLAVVLNWEALKYRTLYRTLLFLPYAVPGFISILVFKGLFNQNFGEINAILHALFGIRPAWFADPLLAKVMLLIVNTWLGFPYFMVLCTGLIKAIPGDLYEASALAGASPLTNFFRITAPLIAKPLTPLLISAFAFNFNNFVLIALLTDGRPDFLNTKLPAGTTDILVSYTYRIAFTDAGQNFGLAAAISTLIFILVALMSWAQLRVTASGQKASR
jgi:maltose/maltodextrin transport system permease protein